MIPDIARPVAGNGVVAPGHPVLQRRIVNLEIHPTIEPTFHVEAVVADHLAVAECAWSKILAQFVQHVVFSANKIVDLRQFLEWHAFEATAHQLRFDDIFRAAQNNDAVDRIENLFCRSQRHYS
jgi:hypothetical protein